MILELLQFLISTSMKMFFDLVLDKSKSDFGKKSDIVYEFSNLFFLDKKLNRMKPVQT